ncbi:hypothetical protein [uncultured Methanomethylovorans sp.]|uniref:hypothetical protein n=1 Tax=uncultured Methanomethylovorans sp. TaxID=183759 RepID=UPI002AA65FE5|nr:hypothetical protein [uncultured Methanomethylovorans sp.]
MTGEEAKTLSDETVGLLRTIMDLKEIEGGISKKREKEFHEMFSSQWIEEIHRWLNFLKDAKKK